MLTNQINGKVTVRLLRLMPDTRNTLKINALCFVFSVTPGDVLPIFIEVTGV
jgi:hypothetical protein